MSAPLKAPPASARLKVENDALMDKLGRIMQAMTGASHELAALKRQLRHLEAENTALRAELRRLRGRLSPDTPAGSWAAATPGDSPNPPAAAPG